MRKTSLRIFDNKGKQVCKECQKKFPEYIQGHLGLEEEHLLVLHVRKCKECMEELEAYYMFASAFKFLEDSDDTGITTTVRDLLKRSEDEYTYVKRHRITLIIEIITTGILIGVIIAFFMNQNIREIFIWGR